MRSSPRRLFPLLALVPLCGLAAEVAQLRLANPSDFPRPAEPIYVCWSDLGLPAGTPLTVSTHDTTLPSETVDHNLDGQPDGLLFLADFSADEKRSVTISTAPGDAALPAKRTAAFAPPGAGPVLESTAGSGRLQFGTGGAVTWPAGPAASGGVLGAGGFGFWNGREVLPLRPEATVSRVIADGRLMAAVETVFRGCEFEGRRLDVTARFSQLAGSPLVKVHLTLSEVLPKFAIGFARRPGASLLRGDLGITAPAYLYEFVGEVGADGTGLALINLNHRGKRLEQTTDAGHHVSVIRPVAREVEYWILPAVSTAAGEFSARLTRELERVSVAVRRELRTARTQSETVFPLTAEAALGWAARLADAELNRSVPRIRLSDYDRLESSQRSFHYEYALLMLAYDALERARPTPAYAQALRDVVGSYVTADGRIANYEKNYNIDAVNGGRALLRLFERTGEERFKLAAGVLRDQLRTHPRTSEGAFWHKQIYPGQLWLDGVYMGIPFLVNYSAKFENGHAFDEAIKEFTLTRARLRDPATGLYYHAWDENRKQVWADPATGRSRLFWSRGLGWLALALVDTLDYLPAEDTAHRQPLLDMITELAPALVRCQDAATGTWWQILDQPDRTGNYLESSGTAMFAAFFAKAVNRGYLPESYRPTAIRAYEGLVREFIRVQGDGTVSLTNACSVAGLGYGRDGSYAYYMREPVADNDRKAMAPFIFASVEFARLVGRTP